MYSNTNQAKPSYWKHKTVVGLSLIGTLNIVLLCFTLFTPRKSETQIRYLERTKDQSGRQSFMEAMRSFPWVPYKKASHSGRPGDKQRYSTLLLETLLPFVVKPPVVPANESCKLPPLRMPSSAPECKPLPKPRKIGLLWKFGFDVDALEIHLNELDGLVDRFFIAESLHAHSAHTTYLKKPLVWDLIKYDKRFAKFSDKVVHFVVDDASLSHINPKGEWSREMQQEELRWLKFLEWNNASKYFGSVDLLGFGDVDEVPSRDNVFFLKNCQLPSDPIDVGIWFPFGDASTIFASDSPAPGHKYTLAVPTFWSLQTAWRHYELSGKIPTKMSGRSSGHLLGGMHLSKYSYMPFKMMKFLTMTELSVMTLDLLIDAGMLYSQNKTSDAMEKLNRLWSHLKPRIQNLEDFRKSNRDEAQSIVKVPWFLNCNWARYPSFNKQPDKRQDAI